MFLQETPVQSSLPCSILLPNALYPAHLTSIGESSVRTKHLVPHIDRFICSVTPSRLASRATPGQRWFTPDAPGVALVIIKQNPVPQDRLNKFLSSLQGHLDEQIHGNIVQQLPWGFQAHEECIAPDGCLTFEICPSPAGTPALTWQSAQEAIHSLSRFMALGGGFSLLQFYVSRAGVTPAQDVQFANGVISRGQAAFMPNLAFHG